MSKTIRQITLIIESYQKITSRLLSSWNNRIINEENLIFHHILERHLYNVSAVKTLLIESQRLAEIKLAINLLMRVTLLDSLTLIHLALAQQTSKEKLLNEIAKLDSLIASSMFKELKDQQEFGKITDEEFQKNLTNLKSYFPNNFSRAGEKVKLINKKYLNASKIWENLSGTPYSFHEQYYELYRYYSSFEHLSRTTLRVFNAKNFRDELKNLTLGLYYITHSSYVGGSILFMNSELVEKLKEIPPILLELDI